MRPLGRCWEAGGLLPLTHLSLRGAGLSSQSLQALLVGGGGGGRSMSRLLLGGNSIGPEGLELLASSQAWPALQELDLVG